MFPLLPKWPDCQPGGVKPTFAGLNPGGLPIFLLPPGYNFDSNFFAVYHECGHAYQALLESLHPTTDFLSLYWAYRGFQGHPSDYLGGTWQSDPHESWAEAFKNAIAGKFIGESTQNWGKDVDPLSARNFFWNLEGKDRVRVLIQLSHHSDLRPNGWSGAPGEADWVQNELVPRIVQKCADRGIQTVLVNGDLGAVPNDNDALVAQRNPQYAQDYDAFISPHYEANIHHNPDGSMEGGWLWGRAAASTTAAEDDRLGAIWTRNYRAYILGGDSTPQEDIQQHEEWLNPNITDYYAFRQTTEKTPGILVEHGVGAPDAPDYQYLRDHAEAIATLWADTLAEFGNVSTSTGGPKVMPSVTPDSSFAVFGVQKKLLDGPSTLPADAAKLYSVLCAQVGLRPELLFAQMRKETANWTFLRSDGSPPPSGYDASWNNPAGLGVTGAAGVGNRFPTLEDGIRAQIGHWLWYFLPADSAHVPGFCDKDQRHFGAHKGYSPDIRNLNGHWAVPGTTYGETIVALADSLPDLSGDPFWDHADAEPFSWGDMKAYNTKLIEYLRSSGLTLK